MKQHEDCQSSEMPFGLGANSPQFRVNFIETDGGSFVTPIDASKSIEEKLTAASGKPLLVHRDPNCSGHATIKIASDDA